MRALYSAGRRFVWRPAPVIGSRAMKAALVLGLAALTLLAPAAASAVSIQEALLLATPAVALVTAEVRGEVTMNCGRGTVTVRPTRAARAGRGGRRPRTSRGGGGAGGPQGRPPGIPARRSPSTSTASGRPTPAATSRCCA